jgi:hypothetical protein
VWFPGSFESSHFFRLVEADEYAMNEKAPALRFPALW